MSRLIQVYEYGRLLVGEKYGTDRIEFTKLHFDELARYITRNEGCPYFTLYYNSVRFNQYVGVIQINDLTIEVLPKTDNHTSTEAEWQKVLIKMLQISLHINSKTTTISDISTHKLNVLESYIMLFLEEVKKLQHHGLIKKYRKSTDNQTSLNGKLQIHTHIVKNLTHAERFFVEHNVYDRNNIYNSIIHEALVCLNSLSLSNVIKSGSSTILLDFPYCDSINVTEKTFTHLSYDRKTERYKTAIQLAKIILLNYHPDFKGGKNNILAIMVDMNQLWENYIYFILNKSIAKNCFDITVSPQLNKLFWEHPDEWSLRLRPDIVIEGEMNGKQGKYILDTKWKYKKDTTTEDVRQMYTYTHYFNTQQSYLLYPEKLPIEYPVKIKKGTFYKPTTLTELDTRECGLIWIDLITTEGLNTNIGDAIIEALFQ